MAADSELDWSSGAYTSVGNVRKINEDALFASDDAALWAVADGMGGHEAGDLASNSIVDALNKIPVELSFNDAVESTRETLLDVNAYLHEQAALRNGDLIGSTVVVLIARADRACCLWAGDSRLYLLRNGRLEQISEDHSRVQELINSGKLRPSDAGRHPESNVVTRALGVAPTVELARIDLAVQPGDTFLLCSDGLSGTLSEKDLGRELDNISCQEAAESLVARSLDAGARDNVTAVVVKAFDDSATQLNPSLVEQEGDDKTLIHS